LTIPKEAQTILHLNYQVKKLRLFLTSVQSNLFVSYFACNEFGRLATIPKITIKKSKSSGWFVSIWVLDDLCNHSYPFILPNLFNVKLKNKTIKN